MKSFEIDSALDVEPVQFELGGEVFTVAPQPTGRILSIHLKMRTANEDDAARLGKEIVVWLGRGLNPEHEAYRGAPGHTDLDNPVEGCQGCRIEIMLEEGRLKPEKLVEIAGYVMQEMSSRPPTKSSS